MNEENKSKKNEDAKKPMKGKDECILDVWLLKPKRNKAIQTQNAVFFSSLNASKHTWNIIQRKKNEWSLKSQYPITQSAP